MDRREFLMSSVAAGVVGLMSNDLLAQSLPPISPMGIASASMRHHLNGLEVLPPLSEDSIAYVDYCRSLGAGGLQFSPVGDLKKVRARMEDLGMWFEGQARPPSRLTDSAEAFEDALIKTREMGGKVVRFVSRPPAGTSGRRYNGFTSMEEFLAWREEADKIVLKCLPIAERYGIKLALENHKDRLVDEHVQFIEEVSSEYLGALVDPGNNLSMMESPEEVCTKLAPYVLSCSLKDMGVAPYEEGFLLSEVIFDTGATDQRKCWEILKAGNPDLNPIEELITRDPLKVPCLTEAYWGGLPHYSAAELARHMSWVRENTTELPYVDHLSPREILQAEEDNHLAVIEWSRTNIKV